MKIGIVASKWGKCWKIYKKYRRIPMCHESKSKDKTRKASMRNMGMPYQRSYQCQGIHIFTKMLRA